jgi:NTP pyrophosphatase (non-canonical NTP hydrolase)
MTFDDYQKQAIKTNVYDPEAIDDLMLKTISAMGVAGEAGEVLDKWKKLVVYHNGQVTAADKVELAKEMGDVLWYLAVLAEQLGISFDQIAQGNLAKTQSRFKRNTIVGKGDNR